MDINKVIELFESKYTGSHMVSSLAERQASAIIQMCKQMVNEDK